MAEKKTFFRKDGGDKKAPARKKEPMPQEEERDDFVTYGAAWIGQIRNSDYMYASIRVSGASYHDLLAALKATDEDEGLSIMMFPNRNQREGKNDPDYYLFPSRPAEGE